ncbi:MAG TPA: zf-HC2 domain-containing protein [Trebonia sp.]|nr:zf-HC2 domain-containing protein [Trebonia sp.]
MSHLGDLLSALVDGELSGTELDRANAHLAACGACRVEANSLRRLKQDLRALAEVSDADRITLRLLAMTSQDVPAGPGPARRLGYQPGARHPRRAPLRRRVRYVLWSALSLIVVGIGAAAFGMGGGTGAQEPKITPQLEVFDAQHAITSGDVPFVDPADVPARVPAMATTP